LRATVLRGGRGGGRFPELDEAVAAPRAGAAPPFFGLRFFDFDGRLRRASRMMNQPIAMITSTPATNSPNTPRVLTVGSLEVLLLFDLLGVLGVVGAGVGAGWAGASGPNAPPPGGEGDGTGVGVAEPAPDWAAASGAMSRSATRAATREESARKAYPGGVPPELGLWLGGATPPLCGSLPPGVPLDGVPVPDPGVEDAGGVPVPPLEGTDGADGVPELGVPPPEPPIGEPPEPFFAFLFFLVSPGCTGSPVIDGTVTGCTVWLDPEPPPPPLDATATRTIRKKAITASATSRRRR
jgi:hypothetical protein